jgi:hypothetical protein
MLIGKSGIVGSSEYTQELSKIIFTSHDFRPDVFFLHKFEQHIHDVYIVTSH